MRKTIWTLVGSAVVIALCYVVHVPPYDAAEAARIRTSGLEGFRDAPDGFLIDRYELDRDHWQEGYITVPVPPQISD